MEIKLLAEEWKATEEAVSELEIAWERTLPEDYKRFLLQHNGGIPYPNWPVLGPDNTSEIWEVSRFLSVGDLLLQRKYPMPYGLLHDIDPENFEEANLEVGEILVFAIAERGVYFLNLSPEAYGRVYIANFSGGDGISMTSATSFGDFYASLAMPEWAEEDEFDPDFSFRPGLPYHAKVKETYLYSTPDDPALGLARFKTVFGYTQEVYPATDGYPSIVHRYVDDKPKLDYLLEEGCTSEGLLLMANRAETIAYLVREHHLDINRPHKGRYPLQRYLSGPTPSTIHGKYRQIEKLMEMGIDLDWSIEAKLHDGGDDLPMIDKLRELHEVYQASRAEEAAFQVKYGRPSGQYPFIEGRQIKKKLGIA